jgi:acyl dehydratase
MVIYFIDGKKGLLIQMNITEGKKFTCKRIFSKQDVRDFSGLTGDDQARHTEPDGDGRLMVQGLLTGSMVTKLGGQLEILAHTIDFSFKKPLYTGEEVRCEMTVETLEEQESRRELTCTAVWIRDGELVAEARVEGVITK